jgi:hypothetical protein
MNIFKKTIFIFGCLWLGALSCGQENIESNYLNNPNPLLPTKFIKLPLGTIKPAGWLKNQLQAQAHGLTGHLDEFWPDLIHSAWKGDKGESWERGPYYLDGLLPLAYLLEDSILIEKTRPWIEWILNSNLPNGWFGPEGNQDRWPLAVAMKVIQQYYDVTEDIRAVELLQNYFRYLHDTPPDWPDDSWRGVRAMENAVTGYWLYRRNQDSLILETIQSIFENSFDWTDYFFKFPWDSLAVANNKVPHNWEAEGLTAHVVNVAMAVKYPGLWYQQSGDKQYKIAVYSALENLDKHHGQVAGRFSGDEHLSGKKPTQGTELCAVIELMFSLENLCEIFGDPALADRLELLAYNALPGTMTPDCWAHQYDQQANQVLVSIAEREWSTNGNTSNIYGLMPNYPCCLANMHQGWPKLVQHMWMATNDGGLVAMIYGPNTIHSKVADNVEIKIVQRTNYPFEGEIEFEIELQNSAFFPLYFRVPQWAENATLSVNKTKLIKMPVGQIFSLKRKWASGDIVNLKFPMKIRAESRYNQSMALRRGPLYYSLRIGKEYKKITLSGRNITSIEYQGSTDWEIRPSTPWNYGLFINGERIDERVSVQKNPIQKFPFADRGEMVYSEDEQKYKIWEYDAPIVLTLKGKIIPMWGMKNNSADNPPLNPPYSIEKVEELRLVPYGSARLRITEFPMIKPD